MLLAAWTWLAWPAGAKEFVWYDGKQAVSYHIRGDATPVVHTAAEMFASDMLAVTGQRAVASRQEKRAAIRVVELDRASKACSQQLAALGVPVEELRQKTDGFYIAVKGGQVWVVGENGRGAAYGLLEMSRMAGVSPWIWWGDVTPEKRRRLTIDDGFSTLQGASVEYRGIFINDEDWSTRPWSYGNYEREIVVDSQRRKAPWGHIGRNSYKKIFQLLIRLRANAVWPAMHEGTVSFFRVPGAKAVADSCGIAVGSSHCEPLLRSNTGEWDSEKRGRYNYLTNRAQVQAYWAERLREVKGSQGGNMLTIGMRGIHDGPMEGVNTPQEKLEGLQQVIDDQQELIRTHLGAPSRQMQVLIPYKEVLEIYNRGLKVPDYVTLMWCDDNYGYITRLSDAREQQRSGGGGVYYHLSYWGRPHDYLWLTTTQPGLIYNEMKAAYDHQVRKLWLVNVHDPKVAGYDLELFLDMAWNIQAVKAHTLHDHYRAWLCRQFGEKAGRRLFPVMLQFYRLCGERRPEFMGWNQVELDSKVYDYGLGPVRNSEFSLTAFGGELDRYLERYASIARAVGNIAQEVRPELKDAYFAAIEYPVRAADAHARKLLWAQKARSLASQSSYEWKADLPERMGRAVAQSLLAYRQIGDLTRTYNDLAQGKWRGLMDMQPRQLPVFGVPALPLMLTDAQMEEYLAQSAEREAHPLKTDGVIARQACDYRQASAGAEVVQMLGHSMQAVALPKGGTLEYDFRTEREGDAVLRVALIPTQPNDDGPLRFSVSVDGAEPTVFSLKEPFRSEQWKLNVLRGQAVRTLPLQGVSAGSHTLTIRALDAHIVVDQWMVDQQANRKFYLFPVESPCDDCFAIY